MPTMIVLDSGVPPSVLTPLGLAAVFIGIKIVPRLLSHFTKF